MMGGEGGSAITSRHRSEWPCSRFLLLAIHQVKITILHDRINLLKIINRTLTFWQTITTLHDGVLLVYN